MTSTRLPHETYLQHITTESRRFRDVLADTDPETPVPSAPAWTASDLLGHLANVQRFWHDVVATRPATPGDDSAPEPPPRYSDRLGYFDEWHGRFVALLARTDPDEPAWNWSGVEQVVGFTFRRQAHEALIHRLDAELTAGPVTGLDPNLALDGVDEVIDRMYGGLPPWGTFTRLPHTVELRASDPTRSVHVQLGLLCGTSPWGKEYVDELDIHSIETPHSPADAVVTATAEDLDAWLWHRRDDECIEITGDRAAYDRLAEVLAQPLD